MELKEYRLERLRSACAEAGADMIVATLPANLNYITTGYVCVNQDVLTRAECAIGYIPAKDKYVYIVGYAELPPVFEFAGLDTEVHFYGGAFCFENGDKGNPFVEKIMAYQKEAHPTSADAWNAAVRANLPEGATVAIDESRIFASVLKNVEEKLSGYQCDRHLHARPSGKAPRGDRRRGGLRPLRERRHDGSPCQLQARHDGI